MSATDVSKGSSARRLPYRLDVQALRAVAVAMVVLYHAGVAMPGGYVGVDVFFVLSGFVIGRGLLDELERTDRIDLKAFALRRVRRLLPAFALLVSVVVLLSSTIGSYGGFSLGSATAIWASLFNANTHLTFAREDYFSASTELNPLLHTWSLSIEEQFYFVFPSFMLIAWIVGRRSNRTTSRRALAVALSAVVVTTFLLSTVLVLGWVSATVPTPFGDLLVDRTFAFYNVVLRSWEFAAGALVAFVRAVPMSRRAAAAGTVTAALSLGIAAVAFDEHTAFPGPGALVPVAATVVLLIVGERSPLQSLFARRPLQWLGELSYGWYLWHWPAIVFAAALTTGTSLGSDWLIVAAAVGSLLPASLSLRLVENPIRHMELTPRRTLHLAAVCVMVPVAIVSLSLQIWDRYSEPAFTAVFDPHPGIDVDYGCDRSVRGVVDRSRCNFQTTPDGPDVLLVGDSNAGHFAEGAVAGFAEAGANLRIDTLSSCPFADTVQIASGREHGACQQFVDLQVSTLIADPVDVVLIGHAADVYINNPDYVFVDAAGTTLRSPEAKMSELADAFGRTIQSLTDAGIEVVVLQPVPRASDWDPLACSVLRWRTEEWGCERGSTFEDLEVQRAQMAILEASFHEAGARIEYPGDALCDGPCPGRFDDGTYVYRDARHISVSSSERLSGFFAELLAEPAVPSSSPAPNALASTKDDAGSEGN